MTKPTAYILNQFQFGIEVDSPYFQFDAMEALLEFLFDALLHLFKGSHPYETVDGNTLFATREGGVEENG